MVIAYYSDGNIIDKDLWLKKGVNTLALTTQAVIF